MRIPKEVTACAGVLALGAGAFAVQALNVQRRVAMQDRFVNDVATVLNMTSTQRDEAQTAFTEARKAAEPVREDLLKTRHALMDAVKSDDTAQIQRLSSTEGKDIGDLVRIRSTAMAKVYKDLTPDQKTRATALHDLLMERMDESHGARSAT
jgi:Spy/CpxP family protein refolding chaperone